MILLVIIFLIGVISCFGGLLAALVIGMSDGRVSVTAIAFFIAGSLVLHTISAAFPYGGSHFTARSKLSTSETGTFYGVSDHILMKNIKFDVSITEYFVKESGELAPKIRYLIVDNRVFVKAGNDIIYLPNVSTEELYEEFPLASPEKGDK